MKIHEYQAKRSWPSSACPCRAAKLCSRRTKRARVAAEARHPVVVVKAQIHAGGRGKAGGVKLARSADEAATSPNTCWA